MSQKLVQVMLRQATWGLVGSIAMGLSSCTSSSTLREADSLASDAASEDALQVVTTILPVTQFTTAVAGDRAQVTQLLPTSTP